MPQLIKDGALQEDSWTLLTEQQIVDGAELNGAVIVPVNTWLERKAELSQRADVGIWLDSDQGPERLDSADIAKLPLIAVNFPAFTDGRGYSYGRTLREQQGFTGELRAIGDVLQDQLFFMKRVGFNAYVIREDRDAAKALSSLRDFSETYQAAVDQPLPLFRRR